MNDIKKKLDIIFLNKLGIDFNSIEGDYRNKPLMGDKFGIPPRDLLCLFFIIEKELEITIPEEDIASGKFSTYNGICEIISNERQKSLTR